MKKMIIIILIAILLLLIGCGSDAYSRFEGKNLHLKKNNKELFWFSGIHCNDPNHRMFQDIKREFSSFKPDLVLVEGNYTDTNLYLSESDAISSGGEPGFVAYLASSSNVPVEIIEPSLSEQYIYLAEKFNKDDIIAMYLLRQINQYQRESENIEVDFFKYTIGFLKNMKENGFPIAKEVIDSELITNILEPYIGFKADSSNWKSIPSKDLVYLKDNNLNSIWKETLKFRDDHCIKLISTKMENSDKIFIMMGADHIKNQEEALKKLYE